MIKKKFFLLCFSLILCLMWTSCGEEESISFDTSQRGNSDYNIHNLGLSAKYEEKIFTVGTENGYDLLFEADENAEIQTALSGLVGYIQYLNVINDTCYFAGITYDENENRTEAIFSVELTGENQNCLYSLSEGQAITYLSAVGDLLIFAAEDESGKTTVRAINPADQTEAILFKENQPIRSLQIQKDRFYFISDDRIFSSNLDGSDKTKIYQSDHWIGNLIMIGNTCYFVESGENDRILAVSDSGGEVTEIFGNGKYISNMNLYGEEIIFSDHSLDAEGNLKKAVFYRLDTQTAEITELLSLETEYTGIEICGDLLLIHLNDEHLTLQTVPLS